MLNNIVNYIISIVDIVLVLFCVSRFIPKVKANKSFIILFVVLQTIVNNFSAGIIGEGNPIRLLILLITTGFFYKFIFEEGIITIYAYTLLALIITFVTEAVAVLIVMLFGMMPTDIHSNLFAMVVGAGISKALFFAVIVYFVPKLKLLKTLNKMKVYQILLVCMFNLIIIFMALWFYNNTNSMLIKEHSVQYIILTTVGAVLFSLGIISITKGIISQSQKEAEWIARENEYKRQMFYIANIQEMLASIKAQRHDFNNHINCLYGLIKLEKSHEAQQYIERLAEDTIRINNIIDAGNPVLTAILNTKSTAAQRDKINMDTAIELPENIKIEPIDLSIIVSNLLDNALEACKSEDVENKHIMLDMRIRSNNLIIKVSNSKSSQIVVNTNAIDAGFTSKPDSANHGFGLSNIKHAVNKYGGIVKFEDKGSSFTANIALPIS